MRTSPRPSAQARIRLLGWLAAITLFCPAAAQAQYGAPELSSSAVGENYHVEVSGSFWNPDLFGEISSERFGIIGSRINFVDDLGFEKTRFKDFRIVLRPTRRAKFRVQYTPLKYESETSLKREIIFNGQKFPVALPVQSVFKWDVLRIGYEYDLFYRPRGYVGILLEGRMTRMTADLASPLITEFTKVRAPLPAIGVVGRAYILPEVALNFEVSTFQVPDGTIPDVSANYYDWDLHGTVNVTNNVGLQVGWRRMSNFLTVEKDIGDVKFQGLWFGGALRY